MNVIPPHAKNNVRKHTQLCTHPNPQYIFKCHVEIDAPKIFF